jgi:threonyl-tRNA synthetase
MYDLDHPALSAYVRKFPARQYRVTADKGKNMFLRFAACFGQYLMAHDMVISYKNLPLRLFELAKSFRKEQHGEVSGIKRLRSFTMPDMHTICRDEQQATEEFRRQFDLSCEWANLIGIDGEIALRFVRDFYDKHEDFAVSLVQSWGKPVLVEMWDTRYFYFVMKFEVNMNDSVGKSFALSTVQIDVENPVSFDIRYINETNEHCYPHLLHASISGGIDRCVCAILENEALKMRRGEKGSFPFWLAPTQVRFIPVSDGYVEDCTALADRLGARVDVDDRDLSVSRKIREAEKEWVPVIIVYGEHEHQQGLLKPRYRFEGWDAEISVDDLANRIAEELADRPFRPVPLPLLLSRRPSFR